MSYLPRRCRLWLRRHNVCLQRIAIVLLLLVHFALLLKHQ
jgi:hypothetical protein